MTRIMVPPPSPNPAEAMRIGDLFTPAGWLCWARLGMAAAIPYAVAHGWGFPLYVLALFTDVVDGPLARATGTERRAGAVLDGWVDKALLVNTAWTLVLHDRIPAWWMACLFSRELVQAPSIPFLVRRFRLGIGAAPASTAPGRALTILVSLLLGVVLSARVPSAGLEPLVLASLALGVGTGAHYVVRHLQSPSRRDSGPPPSEAPSCA
jgi:phosphatidylglycerophosphate synthase